MRKDSVQCAVDIVKSLPTHEIDQGTTISLSAGEANRSSDYVVRKVNGQLIIEKGNIPTEWKEFER